MNILTFLWALVNICFSDTNFPRNRVFRFAQQDRITQQDEKGSTCHDCHPEQREGQMFRSAQHDGNESFRGVDEESDIEFQHALSDDNQPPRQRRLFFTLFEMASCLSRTLAITFGYVRCSV